MSDALITIVHDFETTSAKPDLCGVVQSAIKIVELHQDGSHIVLAYEETLHHPGMPIPDGASNVHGIYDKDVEGLPDYEISLNETYEEAISEFHPTHVMGYNSVRFDNTIARRVGMPEGLISIDLMTATSRMLSRGHITRARLTDAYEQLTGKPAPEDAHDAMVDVDMTLEILPYCMDYFGFEDISAFVDYLNVPEANPLMKMAFGKHKGEQLIDCPRGYLRWLRDTATDTTADMRASVEAALEATKR